MTIQEKGKAAKTQFMQKTLPDLVKGIRKHKKNEQDYIQKALQEIKQELKHRDIVVKVIAVQKMTYLHMIGYNMEYGAFTIVECMCSEDFTHKRIGYLACAQSFHENVDLIQMIPNLLRNALKSMSQWEQGIALSCLSNICTPELAELLVSEVAGLLTSQRPYIKKKCLLALFKIFLQYPSALRPCFPRIKEKLDDPDPSVTSAAVNVICELARKNPKNYLGMAPVFFKLFSNIQNNWTLIKIVKVFGALAPEEPRLPKKLAEPLSSCISRTPAKSLLYECLLAVASNSKPDSSVMALAVERLKEFVTDPDQNLKYLGLQGLNQVMKNSPQLLSNSKDIIIDCLSDEDLAIRISALTLVVGLVSKRNLHSVVAKMQEQMVLRDDDEFRNIIVQHVVEMCRQHNYAFVTNFEWYIRVLMDLTQGNIQRFEHGGLLGEEFTNVIVRVRDVRPFGIKCVSALLCNPALFQKAEDPRSTLSRVLKAASFLSSEYPEYVPNKLNVVSALMKPRMATTPSDVQTTAIHACLKLYSYASNPASYRGRGRDEDDDSEDESRDDADIPEDPSTLAEIVEELLPSKDAADDEEKPEQPSDAEDDSSDASSAAPAAAAAGEKEKEELAGLALFLPSCDVDVHEHATTVKALIELHQEMLHSESGSEEDLGLMFVDDLRPVKAGAQAAVEELEDIDEPILSGNPVFSDDEGSEATMSDTEDSSDSSADSRKKKKGKMSKKERRAAEKERAAAELARKNNPHYLPSGGGAVHEAATPEDSDMLPPVQELVLEATPGFDDFNLGTRGFKEDRKAKKDKKSKKHKIMLDDDAPEGWQGEEGSTKKRQPTTSASPARDDVWQALDIDLSAPLKGEALPTVKPYVRKEAADIRREEKAREKEKAKERKRELKGEGGGKASKSKRSTLPAGVTVTTAVTDVCKHKGKKKNYVQLTVEVSVLNNSSESLKKLALEVTTDCHKVEAGDHFEADGNIICRDADGEAIKVKKGETAVLECVLTVSSLQVVSGVVSWTGKEKKDKRKVQLAGGAQAYLAKPGSKLNRDAFFAAMSELNDSSAASSVKETVSVNVSDMSHVLAALKEQGQLKPVEVLDSCAGLMGSLVTPDGKQSVCVLLKASPPSSLSIELKTPVSETLALQLVQHIVELATAAGGEAAEAEEPSEEEAEGGGHVPLSDGSESDDESPRKKKDKKEKKSKKSKKEKKREPEPEPEPVPEPKAKKEKKSKKTEEKKKNEKKAKAEDTKPAKKSKKEKKEKKDDLAFLDM